MSDNQQMYEQEDDSISLIEVATTLGEEKKKLFFAPLIIAVITALISLVLPPSYTAKAVFLTPEKQSSSASAILEQLGAAGGALGSVANLKNPGDMYAAIMESNNVRHGLSEKFHLKDYYKVKYEEDVGKVLKKRVKVSSDKKTGFLIVEVEDKDPKFAADLANAHLDEMRRVLKDMSIAEAHQRRDFFEHQIEVLSARPFRDPYVQTGLVSNMIRQYEAARLDEARDSQVLEEVDHATPPERRSFPKRSLMTIMAYVAGLFLTIIWIQARRAYTNAQQNPESADQMKNLCRVWAWGKKDN